VPKRLIGVRQVGESYALRLELLGVSSATSGFAPLDCGMLDISLPKGVLAGGDEIGW
jgi:hypothetical protein